VNEAVTPERHGSSNMKRVLAQYYRLPENLLDCSVSSSPAGVPGFFRLGPDLTCYGRCSSGVASTFENSQFYDASFLVNLDKTNLQLPFDPVAVVDDLRHERYVKNLQFDKENLISHEWTRKAYYALRPLLPVSIRRHMQRAYFDGWQTRAFPSWPLDFTVDTLHEELLRLALQASGLQRIPFIWFWPDGAPNGLIMTHDVETRAGRDFTSQLMDLDERFAIKASFQVIPENRYELPQQYVHEIRKRGFEFNIHDLNHDGNLYQEREQFLARAEKINAYARKFAARGFRAGSMYRMLDWYDAYDFSYDMSMTNVAHLDPKRGGCCTVFPFFIGNILELPLTTAQDYSVFHILNDYSIGLWKQQLAMLRQRNGLMSFLTHPDYLVDRRACAVYEKLLSHLLKMVIDEKIWAALPGDVDQWWRARAQMNLVQKNGQWQIEGHGSERARIAFATIDRNHLVYDIQDAGNRETALPVISSHLPSATAETTCVSTSDRDSQQPLRNSPFSSRTTRKTR
jgi:hypothetical protein